METEKLEYPSEIMKCNNCQYFIDGYCHQTEKPYTKIINPGEECINGFFDPIKISERLEEAYNNISNVIGYYMDLSDDIKNIVTLWIMGTYFHEHFSTFPYLFINAMRGSGKTRLLKLIAAFAKEGQLVNSVTEAIIFRTTGALIIDEFEGVGGKDKNSLKELLNSAYKKGTKVFRMKKKKTVDGESQVVEEFQPYRPIVMANIWGMEEVLGDRCINITLEKSTDLSKIKLVENFSDLDIIKETKKLLVDCAKCSLCSVVTSENIYRKWNFYIYTQYTLHTLNTPNYINYTKEVENIDLLTTIDNDFCLTKDYLPFFKKMDETKLDGRYLELFFPLFLISNDTAEEILNNTLKYSEKVVSDKKIEEVTESKDVLVYSFISKQKPNEWRCIRNLTTEFKLFTNDSDLEWLNYKWMGRALKRLNLVVQKRRVGEGIQVILNVEKAKTKEEIFKPKEQVQ